MRYLILLAFLISIMHAQQMVPVDEASTLLLDDGNSTVVPADGETVVVAPVNVTQNTNDTETINAAGTKITVPDDLTNVNATVPVNDLPEGNVTETDNNGIKKVDFDDNGVEIEATNGTNSPQGDEEDVGAPTVQEDEAAEESSDAEPATPVPAANVTKQNNNSVQVDIEGTNVTVPKNLTDIDPNANVDANKVPTANFTVESDDTVEIDDNGSEIAISANGTKKAEGVPTDSEVLTAKGKSSFPKPVQKVHTEVTIKVMVWMILGAIAILALCSYMIYREANKNKNLTGQGTNEGGDDLFNRLV